MKKFILNLGLSLLCLSAMAQNYRAGNTSFSQENETYWTAWKQDLYDVGIRLNKDSLYISPESKKIMQDSAYRKLIFPVSYTWDNAVESLKRMELKKAFWYLIKLFDNDPAKRQLVMESIIPFDKSLEMDKVLISTFYTYAFLDPRICEFKNNRIVVTHPDILEKEFATVKQMASIIKLQRKK